MEDTDSLLIVEQGMLEVFTSFEGNDFVIERLGKGSVINSRMLFTEDRMIFNVRCLKQTQLLELEIEMIKKHQQEDPALEKQFLMYQNNLLKQGKEYPLDIIKPSYSRK